jgi:hypothetical protein
MNNIQRLWLDALRSGKYGQGRNQLRPEDDKFCCLGVACDIWNPAGWGKEHAAGWDYEGSDTDPPFEFEISTRITADDLTCLMQLNDGEELNFDEIANILEDVFTRGLSVRAAALRWGHEI